ncbi:MAG: pro-sigmaK processing inhibitor BofA family protein [Lachnospiraceae bacterium]|nr:pro-sigmaK processing inhibitor BofA family protein [Lachnospiraceae bacterium]
MVNDLILNFFLRMVMGVIGIYTVNSLLGSLGVAIYAGINLINLLTIGMLGISGFGLVFAVAAFSVL